MIEKPKQTQGRPSERINEIESYLLRLAEQLEFELNDIRKGETHNGNQKEK